MAHGFLAPALRDCSPHPATHGLRHRIRVAPPAPRQGFNRFQDGIVHDLMHQTTVTVALGNADEIKRRILDQLTLVAHRDCHRNGAGKTQPPAVGDRAGIGFDQQHAILVDAARRDLVDDADLRRQLDKIAVAALYDITHAAPALVTQLHEQGWLQPDALKLGLEFDDDDRPIGRDGRPVDGLYYVGPMLKARYWEAIAVPELRRHTLQLAHRLLADVAA